MILLKCAIKRHMSMAEDRICKGINDDVSMTVAKMVLRQTPPTMVRNSLFTTFQSTS